MFRLFLKHTKYLHIFLSDGNMSQTAKQVESGPTIQESSIDEFLGLQVSV